MRKIQVIKGILAFFFISLNFVVSGQPCAAEAPQTYEAVADPANPGQCFIVLDWGTEMPSLGCGTPGNPAAGSTVPNNRKLADLNITIDGNIIVLYDKGVTCDLAYGTGSNTMITTYSSTTFCNAGTAATTPVDGNQTGAAAINCDMGNSNPAAPVTLTEFYAVKRDGKIELNWSTSSEENTDYFDVERSMDGQRFYSLGTVSAVGFSTSQRDYQWEDQIAAKLVYYRLKIVDFDGYIDYSPMVVVSQKEAHNEQLSLFPSPVSETLNLSIDLYHSNRMTIKVFNLSGQLLLQEEWDGQSGDNLQTLDLAGLPSQLLIVQVTGLQVNERKKVWKF